MKIRPATPSDFSKLYEIGKSTPELRVSSIEEFMDADEFKWAITNPKSVFLVAEEQEIAGFIYASAKDLDRPFMHKYACLVYFVVSPKFRRRGIAKQLYIECEKGLKKLGMTHVYIWANSEGNGEIIELMKKQGFSLGHKYSWMDKKIS